MASIATEIKGIFMSHLRRTLFGENIYGRFETTFFDGKRDRISVLEVRGASRFMRHGVMTIYHPHYGKWQATLLSEHHCGKPVQVLTADEIRANLDTVPSQDFVHRVYEVEKPNVPPPVWDPYWENQK